MDIFSAGCVLLETALNGQRALDLGDLMDYRKKGSFPQALLQKLQKIESSSLRAACRHMLDLDPAKRLASRQYLERLESIMPSTFGSFFQNFMERVTCEVTTPDARIALAAAYYGRILELTAGIDDREGVRLLNQRLGETVCSIESPTEPSHQAQAGEREDTKGDEQEDILAETEELLRKLEKMTFDQDSDLAFETAAPPASDSRKEPKSDPTPRSKMDANSLLIYTQLILSNLRHVKRPSSKLVSLHLLGRLAMHSSDETKLQRITPSAISLLQDPDPLVKATALHVMTNTVSKIQSFPPSDAKVFPQYILKRVAHLVSDPSLVVRVAFAKSVAPLAETAHRFLDISHAVRLYEAVGAGGSGSKTPDKDADIERASSEVFGDNVANLLEGPDIAGEKDEKKENDNSNENKNVGGNTLISSTYHTELGALHDTVSRWVIHLTTDQSEQSSPPKRALLRELSRLCNFFGRDGVMAFILPQILSFLNDHNDWQLRAALFEDMPSVCYIIGRAASEHFVLPCLETALVDSEDQVLSTALNCLANLVDTGLLSRNVLVDTKSRGTAR